MRWHIHRNQLSPSKAETKTRNGKTTQLKQETNNENEPEMANIKYILSHFWQVIMMTITTVMTKIELGSGTNSQNNLTWNSEN